MNRPQEDFDCPEYLHDVCKGLAILGGIGLIVLIIIWAVVR